MCGLGGVHGGAMCDRGVHGRVYGRGVYVAGTCVAGGCMAGETAIAAGSTHPTGMHSCFNIYSH